MFSCFSRAACNKRYFLKCVAKKRISLPVKWDLKKKNQPLCCSSSSSRHVKAHESMGDFESSLLASLKTHLFV